MDSLATQVPDDQTLLHRMMSDLSRSDELYRPTNYWAYYERFFLPELTRKGLRDFRRRHRSVLTSFGGTDLHPRGVIELSAVWPGSERLASALNRVIDLLPGVSLGVWGSDPDSQTKYFYRHVKRKFDALNLSLTRCGTSTYGSPEDLVEIEGSLWSLKHLQYCSIFADVACHTPLPPDVVLVELGAGLGRNIEVLAHLFPRATLLLFDIPPQLYVAHQYLTTVFADRVIGYDAAVTLTPDGSIPDNVRGKIVILPTFRFPDWAGVNIDVFWNSASFQEMEPDVVTNYLRLVVEMSPRWVYINALPGGNYLGDWKPGRGGTRMPVLERYYTEGLKGRYELRHQYPTDYFLRDADYMSYIFERIYE